jgi:transcription elongation factor GreA
VLILSHVTIRNLKNNATMKYCVVPESEADLKNGKLSVNSPIAKGLLGKRTGDVAEIKVPAGVISFEILEVAR